MFNKGERVLCKATPRFSAFGVQILAECPEGSKGSCIGFDNKLSRSCTLCQEWESRERGSSPGESQIALGAWENTQKDQGGSNTKKQ